jgi:magnesium transporter
MKELSFNQGRLAFDPQTLTMLPCLPDALEYRVKVYFVDGSGLNEAAFSDFEKLKALRENNKFVWMHLAGTPGDDFWKYLHDFLDLSDEQIKYLRGPHKNAFQEEFGNGVFWSLMRASTTEAVDAIESVNFFMAEKVLFTRQFSHEQMFTFVSHKLMERGEHVGNIGVDCLATVLIENVLNSYVDLLKQGGVRLEEIQNKIILHPGKEELDLINRAQQLIWIFLNHVWPMETLLQAMQRSCNDLWREHSREQILYRRDEATALLKMFETYRDMSYHLMDVYVSNLSLRTNRTTTILTMIATLILPPSLIAAIYGMNFFIPEVHATFGYYVCLICMVLVSGGLMLWLKYKGYIEL